MTNNEGADLHKRVERYEAAVDELRAAHQDVKELLLDQVLFERWQQIGAELGFTAMRQSQQHDLPTLGGQVPEMSGAWGN